MDLVKDGLDLSPGELFYLGSLLRAAYIDYAYIAAMEDMSGDFKRFSKTAAAALGARGVLEEDFSGNLALDPAAAALLRPIFFGTREAAADVCRMGDQTSVESCRFHFFENEAVMVTAREGRLLIQKAGRPEILGKLQELVPAGGAYVPGTVQGFPEGAVDWTLVWKTIQAGAASSRRMYVEAGGVLYREKGGDSMEAVTREALLQELSRSIEEV